VNQPNISPVLQAKIDVHLKKKAIFEAEKNAALQSLKEREDEFEKEWLRLEIEMANEELSDLIKGAS
jgi:hypothetical protein